MTGRELLRKLRRLGVRVEPSRGKGGHVRVVCGGRSSYVPTGSGELKRGLVHAVLKDLGLTIDDLR